MKKQQDKKFHQEEQNDKIEKAAEKAKKTW